MVIEEYVKTALEQVEALELELFRSGADPLLQDQLACIRTDLRMSLGTDPLRLMADEQ